MGSQAYDPAIGMKMAWLEKAVYCGADRFNHWDVGDSVKNGPVVNSSQVHYVHEKTYNAQAGIGRMISPDGCFVAFKGTDGDTQSILDAVALLVKFNRSTCSGCNVHDGWLKIYESIKEDIFQTLARFH